MGGSIKTVILLFIALGNASFGFSQSVFNVAFDESNTANHTANALEVGDSYFFVQKTYKNNAVQLEGVELDNSGIVVKKQIVVFHPSLNIFYGYPGSLQYLTSNEFCQLYHIGPDSGINVVFFDSNLAVTRDKRYDFGYFLNAGVVKQVNDSTLLVLGRIKNSTTYDLFLINTDLQGNERWRTIFGDSGKNDYGYAIEMVNNKIVVGAQTYQNSSVSNPHLFILNNTGNPVFDTTYFGYNNGGYLAYHPNYGLYLSASRNLSGGGIRPSIIRLNANFTIDWAKEYFRDKDFVYLGPHVISDNGTITTAGSNWENGLAEGLFFQSNHLGDSLGSKLIEHIPGERAQFDDIRPTSDGGYILAGETHIPGQDSWIVKVNAWGCDNIPCIVSVNEPEISIGELNCYPNPINGAGTISGSLSSLNGESKIRVFNSIGQLIQTISITQKDFEVQVNLTRNGLYLVNLYQGTELVRSRKWVVR
ncbi:MAG: hypothetical protein ACI85Q_002854 [Salibacteraceae bacterium]|jgi:hypothetical protein